MNTNNTKGKNANAEGTRKFTPGILTYAGLKSLIFTGAVRMDRELRETAVKRDPKARNRRQPEVIYQWNISENDFWMRLYSTLDTDRLVTRAQRTGHAKLRLTVRDNTSKQVVEFVSASYEIIRDQIGWESDLREILNRAYLFVSRLRPQCPKCRKSLMEIRTGPRGQFWGCQQFPECRGTRNIPEAVIVTESLVEPAGTFAANFDGTDQARQPMTYHNVAATEAAQAAAI